jgi:hypothetical protein
MPGLILRQGPRIRMAFSLLLPYADNSFLHIPEIILFSCELVPDKYFFVKSYKIESVPNGNALLVFKSLYQYGITC